MLAKNIPLLLGMGEHQKRAADAVFSHPDDHAENLIQLGKVCRVKVTYKQPVTKVIKGRYKSGESKEHIYGGFFGSSCGLCYLVKAGGRKGYYMPPIDLIESYEPVIGSSNQFKDLEDFSKRFDTKFITQAYIESLWNSTSSQTGERYTKGDFRQLGPQGKRVMARFLQRFIDVNTVTPYHRVSSDGTYTSLSDYHQSNRSPGRDITITHTMGFERVHYSSEYHRCGNGRYGLIANKNEFLWLEDD